jgi:O-antigen ligase
MIDSFGKPAIGSRFFTCVIFLLPALALTTQIGLSLIEALILCGAILYAKPLWLQRRGLFRSTGFIVAAFAFNLVVALASSLSSGFQLHFLDNPIRQVLAVAAIGLIVLTKPTVETFWYGLFAGAFGAACIAFYQRFELGLPRAEGFYMPIMFGDIAMAMGLMSLASIKSFAKTRLAWLPYFAFLAGLSASILSGSRGGWIALMFSFIPLYSYGSRTARRGVIAIILASVSLFTAACFVPNLKVRERLVEVSTEIQQYRLGNVETSVGFRLEVWKGSWKIFADHPLVGVGRANYNLGLNDLIASDQINPLVNDFHHAHNEMLHALATEGVIGGMALLFLYAAPCMFFMRILRRNDASQPVALAGLLLVLSFVDFGLTQVLFAHHAGAAFYALMGSVLAGLCIMLQSGEHEHASH